MNVVEQVVTQTLTVIVYYCCISKTHIIRH